MPALEPDGRRCRELLDVAYVAEVRAVEALGLRSLLRAVLVEAREVRPLARYPVARVAAGKHLLAGQLRLGCALGVPAGQAPGRGLRVAVAAVVGPPVGLEVLAREACVVGRAAALGAEVCGAPPAAQAVAAAVLGCCAPQGPPGGVGLVLGGLEVGGAGGGVQELHHHPAGRALHKARFVRREAER